MFAKFFWGSVRVDKRKHWVAWEEICYPKDEWWLGFKSLFDINNGLHVKIWWRFRTFIGSLWATYIGNK